MAAAKEFSGMLSSLRGSIEKIRRLDVAEKSMITRKVADESNDNSSQKSKEVAQMAAAELQKLAKNAASSAAAAARLSPVEAEAVRRREIALAARSRSVKEDHALALEIEAALVELRREVEVLERSNEEKQTSVDEAANALDRRDDEVLRMTLELEEASRQQRDAFESFCMEMEQKRRLLDDRISHEENQSANEQHRIKKRIAELESREGVLRERQAELMEREHEVSAKVRANESRARMLEDMNYMAIERLQAELKEREELLQQPQFVPFSAATSARKSAASALAIGL